MYPLKVMHVIDSLSIGGAERVLVDLVNAVDRDVVIPSVCVTRAGDMTLASELPPDVKVEQLPRTKMFDLQSMRRFVQIIAQQRIDIIHAHGYSSSRFAMTAGLIGARRPPLVLHAHSSAPPDARTRLIAHLGVKHVIGVSPEIVGWAHDMLGVSSATLISNGLDPQPYLTASGANIAGHFAQRPRLLAVVVANVRPVKDFETLFNAFARSAYRNEIGLLVAGSVEDRDYITQCHALLEALGLSKQVIFLGRRQDVPALLAAADIGLISSRRESGPLALLEYMAAALPFVSTRVGHIGCSAANYGLQGTVPAGDYEAFTEALDVVARLSPAERRQRGEDGRSVLMRHFTRRVQVEQVQSLYRLVSEGNHDARYGSARRA